MSSTTDTAAKTGSDKTSSDKTSPEKAAGSNATDSATSALPDAGQSLSSLTGGLGLDKKAAEDVAGSLKVHIKLALEIDIQITARIKGDIAIGIL